MGSFLVLLALLGLLTGTRPAFAKGGPIHLFITAREQCLPGWRSNTVATTTKRILGRVWSWALSRSGDPCLPGPADVGR